ncbi:MAG: succinate dehydrogenase cytochrome b subunit [Deltaproteobacteria bacterium]|nr:succinate dehydrogenase cytochrome b subunit [Deltaproteobacteria bacterium]MDH3382618.1 succinate dehydrogenase cytochrome b subunit [Deltaproteobacteria bacterium]
MQILSNTVGRKILMAVSGLFMLFFVIVHLLGNTTIFFGPNALNTYAEKLHSLGPLVWAFRCFMLAMLGLHVVFGVLLTLENWAANPGKYAVNRKLKANFSSETMIWTGAILLGFLVYHLLQFTLRVTPDILPEAIAKRPGDVYSMVVSSFGHKAISLVYVGAMVVLFLHLKHGIQSFFQSLGWNNEQTLPRFATLGTVLSALFLLGYSAIPILILVGFLTK